MRAYSLFQGCTFGYVAGSGDPASISGEVGSPLPGLYRASGEGAFTHESGAKRWCVNKSPQGTNMNRPGWRGTGS